MRILQGWEMFIRHSVSANQSLRWGMPKRLRRCYGGGYLHFITSSCHHRLAILGYHWRSRFLEVLKGSAIWSVAAAHAKRSCQPGKSKSGAALLRILTPTLAKSARVGQPQIEIPPGKKVGRPPASFRVRSRRNQKRGWPSPRCDPTFAVKMNWPAGLGGFRGTTDPPVIPAAPLRAAWRPRAEEWRRNTSVYPPCN